jgi:hypothetical protein
MQPLIMQASRIVDHVMQGMHLPTTTVGNAHNVTRRMVGQVEDLTTQVRQIVSPAMPLMLQPTITLGNAQIAITLALVG